MSNDFFGVIEGGVVGCNGEESGGTFGFGVIVGQGCSKKR